MAVDDCVTGRQERHAGAPLPGCTRTADVLSARREFLSRSVEEIRADLDSRHRLHEDTFSSIEADLRRLRLDRGYLDNWAAGYEPSVESRKSALDKGIADLREALVGEDLAFWRDSIGLHRELREAIGAGHLAEAAGGLAPAGLSLPPLEHGRAASPLRPACKEAPGHG